MIELNTGVPGSGKTLSMVERLSKLQAKWTLVGSDARPVFVLGIPDLLLPHSLVPLKSVQIHKAGAPSLVPDWDAMPDGSLVIIDEAQGCFPPRSSASAAPAHVAWLNTHRHHGFDIWLTTQHPKLIDGTVRALVGRHQHYRRMFGGSRACVYEWDSCADSLSGMNNSVKSYFSYPKKIFRFYKSAEIHTKQSFKIPLWVFIPFLGLVLAAYFVPRTYNVLHNGVTGKGIKEDVSSSSPLKASPEVGGGSGALAHDNAASLPVAAASAVAAVYKPPLPLDGLTFYISGFLESSTKWQYSFKASRDGQSFFSVSQSFFTESGYLVERLSPCSARILYGESSFFVTCNAQRSYDVLPVQLASTGN
jgi:zona occludens toxin